MRLQELSAKLSETEAALGRIQTDSTQLQNAKHQLESKLGQAAANRSDTETRLKEAAERFARAEESIASLREEADAAAAARVELETRLKELTASRAELEAKLTEAESTRPELDVQLKKAADDKSALEQQIQKLQAELQSLKAQSPSTTATQVPVAAVPSDKIEQEIARVQGVLAEVLKLIDDPASALSTVMRKNVEKAELECYLKGIRFATGQGEPK